jgi:hypothetical protein
VVTLCGVVFQATNTEAGMQVTARSGVISGVSRVALFTL